MEATVRVALPSWVRAERQPSWSATLDVTDLVEEWAVALLDPVDAMRRATPAALKLPGWSLCARATVTPSLMRPIRDAGDDPDIRAAIEAAFGTGRMTLQGSCLLLGLAAVTALDANIGKAATAAAGEVKKRADREPTPAGAAAKRERQRSAPAAAEAEVALPTLSDIPAQAWGEDVK